MERNDQFLTTLSTPLVYRFRNLLASHVTREHSSKHRKSPNYKLMEFLLNQAFNNWITLDNNARDRFQKK